MSGLRREQAARTLVTIRAAVWVGTAFTLIRAPLHRDIPRSAPTKA